MTIRVVAIDDSASMRSLYSCLLQSDGIDVVATAEDPLKGRDLIVRHKPDVVLLDIEMPHMDGITFLRQLMRYQPLPVLIISALTSGSDEKAVEALCAGAVDVIPKVLSADGLLDFAPFLKSKIMAAAQANPKHMQYALTAEQELEALKPKSSEQVVVIGASTGGTAAVESVLAGYTKWMPGAVVALHLPARVTRSFANRLNELLPIEVKEAEEGDAICDGRVLLAPGHQHIRVLHGRDKFIVSIHPGSADDPVCPSINRLFSSVATVAGGRSLGILLTGMGDDGADGLLAMRRAGAVTIAEDESTCVVYGMPKAAKEAGAAGRILPLQQMNKAIREFAGLN